MMSEITQTNYTISEFVTWARNDQLDLSPSFQRRPVWPASAKSFLIDTIVRRFPMPIIFLREQMDLTDLKRKMQVVDGQQRIRTILTYIDNRLLKDYREASDYFEVKKIHNSDLAGKRFVDLAESLKSKILNYKVSSHIFPSDTDDRKILEIFARLNSTGVKLNAQELRNANYFGTFKSSMYDLAYEQLERWRNWGVFSENNIARMREVEYTTELVLSMLRGVTGVTKSTLDNFYHEKDGDDVEYPERKEVEKRFRYVMDSIDGLIGDDIYNSEFYRTIMFYCLFVLCYLLHFGEPGVSKKKNPSPAPEGLRTSLLAASDKITNGSATEEVRESISRRTTHKSTRVIVFNYICDECGLEEYKQKRAE